MENEFILAIGEKCKFKVPQGFYKVLMRLHRTIDKVSQLASLWLVVPHCSLFSPWQPR